MRKASKSVRQFYFDLGYNEALKELREQLIPKTKNIKASNFYYGYKFALVDVLSIIDELIGKYEVKFKNG